ncbi:hypothetical protein MAR_024933 [Mya arenaria]|uniref:Uncharacterized protein n=1 Tax=Mya arenaria TaxID=6604 RepID=A0ABY7DV47_MYAAR|nr:hypothetical protein MAR_024933 [Mya arenaria]
MVKNYEEGLCDISCTIPGTGDTVVFACGSPKFPFTMRMRSFSMKELFPVLKFTSLGVIVAAKAAVKRRLARDLNKKSSTFPETLEMDERMDLAPVFIPSGMVSLVADEYCEPEGEVGDRQVEGRVLLIVAEHLEHIVIPTQLNSSFEGENCHYAKVGKYNKEQHGAVNLAEGLGEDPVTNGCRDDIGQQKKHVADEVRYTESQQEVGAGFVQEATLPDRDEQQHVQNDARNNDGDVE